MPFDTHNHWIGIEVSNIAIEGEELHLPKMKQPYVAKRTEYFFQDESKIVVIFDSNYKVATRQAVDCNLDFNVNGLLGTEILVENFAGKMDIANRFIT